MKNIRKIFFWAALVLIIWWLLGHLQVVPSVSLLFKEQPVRIDSSAVWLKEIRSLAQLVTVSAYDEIVADTAFLPLSGKGRLPSLLKPLLMPVDEALGRRLVLIGKVVSHSGINMMMIQDSALKAFKDSIHLTLPPAQVLDTIINPSGIEVFIEKGSWDNNAVNQLKVKMKRLAAANVVSRGLLQQSERKAEEIMTNFFKAAGFQKVTVQFDRNNRLARL